MVRYTLPHFKKGSGPPDNKKLTSITEVPKKNGINEKTLHRHKYKQRKKQKIYNI